MGDDVKQILTAIRRWSFRHPVTSNREYTPDELEFMKALDKYKRDNRRPHPDWCEVMDVFRALGYRKVAEREDPPIAKRQKKTETTMPNADIAPANNLEDER